MTRADIVAELRRSACEDRDAYNGVALPAFSELFMWFDSTAPVGAFDIKPMHLRMFFLLVAEAMNDYIK